MLPIFYLIVGLCSSACSNPNLITLQLKWLTQAQFSGFIVANDKGFYDEQCLQVNIRPGGPGIFIEDEIISGRAQIGISWVSTVLHAITEENKNLSIVSQMFRRAALSQLTWKDSGIKTVGDMRGKRVCVWNVGNEFPLRMAFHRYNLTWDSLWQRNQSDGDADVILQPFSMAGFLARECDSAAATRYNELASVLESFDSEGNLYTLDQINIIDFNSLGTALLEDCIIVSSEWLESNRDVVTRFLVATYRGFMFARDFPLETLDLFIDKTPRQEWQISEVNKLIWPALPDGIGNIGVDLLQRTADAAFQFGLTSRRVDIMGENLFKSDLVMAAQNLTLACALNATSGIFHWSATKYGPGSSDIFASNYQGRSVRFCPLSGRAVVCNEEYIDNDFIEPDSAYGSILLFFLSVCLLIPFLILFGLFWFRYHPVIKASSVLFCVIMNVGALLGTLIIISFLNRPTKSACQMRVWTMGVGFVLFFGSFVLKSYRLHKIFNSERLTLDVTHLTDEKIGLRLAIVLIIQIVLLTVITVGGDLDVYTTVNTESGTVKHQCGFRNRITTSFFTALMLFDTALVLFGVYLAYRLRNIQSAYSESRYLGYSIYNIILSLCLIFPTLSSGISERDKSLTLGLGATLAVCGSLVMLFLPKFWIILHYTEYKRRYATTSETQSWSTTNIFKEAVNEEILSLSTVETLQSLKNYLLKCIAMIEEELGRRLKGGSATSGSGAGASRADNANAEDDITSIESKTTTLQMMGDDSLTPIAMNSLGSRHRD